MADIPQADAPEADPATEPPAMLELERTTRSIIMRWADGSEGEVPVPLFRFWCGCASCSPRRDNETAIADFRKEIERWPVEKPQVKPIGAYGLAFEWSRGCSSGIWTWKRLWAVSRGVDPDGGRPYVHGAW